ncbi:hypothetical protein DFA_04196 [Cavenderia fasciculata]|uniref:Ankyrin repeat-containing protein n=1 Tax=Cavenderia fasciculata TaxID=261658 RepID=F4Q1J9_CACFS|nr:uncharacterized protein DFA_04196 [Cavenderia fasciculata]EGG18700.1 hypothetical protein DFA_04196 [Cavenderia fasciculata]|eukprot:XP_004366604.1 hypothetical protein DFA_04196 [Cavenderia fasciculata]
MTTNLFKNLIFNHVKDIYSMMSGRGSKCGRDIINSPHLEMISRYAMSWNFIKHYLPEKDNVLVKRRWYVISQYCQHENATLDTLIHLLEWSPDYNPQNELEECHQDLFYNVASRGHRDILELLLQRYPNISMNGDPRAMHIASANGHLSTIQLLSSSVEGIECTTDCMDEAASNGHLNVVMYLDQTRSEGCSHNAINWASRNGHFDIVKYLSSHRTEGCTSVAMDRAAENGHFNILEYLHLNRSEGGSTSKAMDSAASNGHYEIVEWLNLNRSEEGCTTDAIDYAAKKKMGI